MEIFKKAGKAVAVGALALAAAFGMTHVHIDHIGHPFLIGLSAGTDSHYCYADFEADHGLTFTAGCEVAR